MSIHALYLDWVCPSFTGFHTGRNLWTPLAGSCRGFHHVHWFDHIALMRRLCATAADEAKSLRSLLHPCKLVYSITEQSLGIISLFWQESEQELLVSKANHSVFFDNWREDLPLSPSVWFSTFSSFLSLLPLSASLQLLWMSGCTKTKEATGDASIALLVSHIQYTG